VGLWFFEGIVPGVGDLGRGSVVQTRVRSVVVAVDAARPAADPLSTIPATPSVKGVIDDPSCHSTDCRRPSAARVCRSAATSALTRIALTARGPRAARAMRGIVREVEGEWEQRLGPEHFAHLRVLLTDLNAHVAADGAPDHGTPAAN
jgi:hypothetical protein